jgi:hypothetical protein
MQRLNAGLSLAEVEVWSGGRNVAQGKSVSSSGGWGTSETEVNRHSAENVVDGKTGGNASADGIFSSASTQGGWIQIDLGAVTAIDEIRFFGRTDGAANQNGDFSIYVSDRDMSGMTVSQLDPLRLNVGRYVMFRKNEGVNAALSLAEVQVFSGGRNLARGKSVASSGSWVGTGQSNTNLHRAENVVDGKTGGDGATDGIFSSERTQDGWIQIDLGAVTAIDEIRFFGRTDEWAHQNGNFTIYVSERDMSGLSLSQIDALPGLSRERYVGQVPSGSWISNAWRDSKMIDGG